MISLLLKNRAPPLQVHVLIFLALLLMVGTMPQLGEGVKCYQCEGESCEDTVECCDMNAAIKARNPDFAGADFVCARMEDDKGVNKSCMPKEYAECMLMATGSTGSCAEVDPNNPNILVVLADVLKCLDHPIMAQIDSLEGRTGRQARNPSAEFGCFCSKDLCNAVATTGALESPKACSGSNTKTTTASGYRLNPFSLPILAILLILPIVHGYIQGMAAF